MPETSSSHAFDFLFGSWRVEHRRLVSRLVDSDDWEEFDGTSTTAPLLGGLGNVEDNFINIPSGSYRAAAFRSFDARTDAWSIWWLDARNPHSLEVPVVGSFIDGVGTFVAHDTIDGQPIVVRFRWLETHTGAPLWEQAFSQDAGQTWEVNWTMRFHRLT